MSEEIKMPTGPALQSFLADLRRQLLGGLTLLPVEIAATDGLVSGTELPRSNPDRVKPVGFVPVEALSSDGSGLVIASYGFNPSPTAGRGFHGVTVTVAAGTIDKVIGLLVGW